jgi:mannose-6-phosphate isomerase-like protein (cupin superfamily)
MAVLAGRPRARVTSAEILVRIVWQTENIMHLVKRVLSSMALTIGLSTATALTQVVDKNGALSVNGVNRGVGAEVVKAKRVATADSLRAGIPRASSSPVTYVDNKKVQATFPMRGDVILYDGMSGVPPFTVGIGHHNKTELAEIHNIKTHIIYVLQGSDEYVTGGTLVNPKTTRPNEIRGTAVEGGETHHLSKGDVVVMPPNNPHWHADAHSLIYLNVAVYAQAAATASSSQMTYIDSKKVAAFFAKPGLLCDARSGEPSYSVGVAKHNKPEAAEIHENRTDIFYILEGSDTFVTGGTLVDPKTIHPNEIRGTGIEGGETYHLSKGDILVVPKSTPYWQKEVDSSVYYSVAIYAPEG